MISAFSSAADVAAAIRTREVSPVDVTELYLGRIERFDDELRSIVWIDPEASLAEARAAEAAVMRGAELGPLHGVPVPVKDLTIAAGQPCFYGSLGMGEDIGGVDDPSIAALRRAGCTLLGRSHSPEAGTMTVTETRRFGIARNPWNPEYSPGGSSGGAGAALAAGFAPFTHASDGGGSIRVPASSCGLVGLKPARGRVPARSAGWEHAATEGAVTRTVRDAALLLDVLSGPEPRAMYNAPAPERPFAELVETAPPRLRIGLVVDAPGGLPVDAECVAAAESAAALLESLGHVVHPIELRTYSPETVHGYLTHIMDAAVAAHSYVIPELAEPYLQVRRDRALRTSSVDYLRSALRIQEESWAVTGQFGGDFDLVLTPTMARLPAPAGELVAEANRQPDRMRLREAQMVAFTSWVNLAGLPAISLPLAMSELGLPIGVQLVAGPWREDLLLRIAAEIEAVAAWSDRIPAAYSEASR